MLRTDFHIVLTTIGNISQPVSFNDLDFAGIKIFLYKLNAMGRNNSNTGGGLDLDAADDILTEIPKLYKVLIHNDDYTPKGFVIFVLKKFFNKIDDDAYKIMMHVHNKGLGIAGIYSFEVAESKVIQVNQFSKSYQCPLKTSFEEEL